MDTLLVVIDNAELKEEPNSCKSFPCWLWAWKRKILCLEVFTSSVNNLFLNEKLDHVFNQRKSAAKVNLAFQFVLENLEDGRCSYLYAYESNAVMDRSKLVCTLVEKTNLKQKLKIMVSSDHCTREKPNTKRKIFNFSIFAIFRSLLKDIHMGFKDNLLPEPLLENNNVNCLTFARDIEQPYSDNNRLFWALALHLHGNANLGDESSKNFNLFLFKYEERDSSKL